MSLKRSCCIPLSYPEQNRVWRWPTPYGGGEDGCLQDSSLAINASKSSTQPSIVMFSLLKLSSQRSSTPSLASLSHVNVANKQI